MKKKLLYVVTTLMFVVGFCVLYYYCPRTVSFELAKEIPKPHDEFDNSHFMGFEYADSKDRLLYWLVEHYEPFYPLGYRYDSTFVENLAKTLDFEKYDYIITYQKELKSLSYSPYLTKSKDGLYYDKRTPLVPIFDTIMTDKVYIYQIIKNKRFRVYGP